jgi:hypothetical protein
MKNTSIFLFSFFALFILVGTSFVMADNSSSMSTPKNWTNICSRINETVSQRIQSFDDGKIKRINSYNNVESSIQNLIAKLKEKGADTTQAESDNEKLQADINNFNTDYSSFITKLEGLKAYSCGSSSGQYAQQLQDAKSFLPVIRNDSIQVREAVMKVRIDLVEERNNILISKLGQRENKTQANYQKRINQIGNRTAIMENRTYNRTPRMGYPMQRVNNSK